jgi:WD40 repeat protein
MASGSADTTVSLWAVLTGAKVAGLEDHTGEVSGVAFSPDGTLLASADMRGALWLWDIVLNERVALMDEGDGVSGVAWSPDGTALAAAHSEGALVLWSLPPE